MHGASALHSALAIKRQRRMREQAKKRAERRLSSRTDSMDSMDRPRNHHLQPANDMLTTSIGMLHIGVCFLAFGLFLIGSGLLPDDIMSWKGGGWWNELVLTGIFVTSIGIFLIILDRVITRKEDDDLEDYVARQLTRSRSGHRLERDVETGCLTTKHHKKFLEMQREDKQRGLKDIVPTHSPLTKSPPPNAINGDAYLEKILEEDVFERDGERAIKLEFRETISTTTTASPGTPSETRELLNGRYNHNARQL